jgi:hypothetical protein
MKNFHWKFVKIYLSWYVTDLIKSVGQIFSERNFFDEFQQTIFPQRIARVSYQNFSCSFTSNYDIVLDCKNFSF